MTNYAEVLLNALRMWDERASAIESGKAAKTYYIGAVRKIDSDEGIWELEYLFEALAAIKVRLDQMDAAPRGANPYRAYYPEWLRMVVAYPRTWDSSMIGEPLMSAAAFGALQGLAFHWEDGLPDVQDGRFHLGEVNAINALLDEVERLIAEDDSIPEELLAFVAQLVQSVRDELARAADGQPFDLKASLWELFSALQTAGGMSTSDEKPHWTEAWERFTYAVTSNAVGGVLTQVLIAGASLGLGMLT